MIFLISFNISLRPKDIHTITYTCICFVFTYLIKSTFPFLVTGKIEILYRPRRYTHPPRRIESIKI